MIKKKSNILTNVMQNFIPWSFNITWWRYRSIDEYLRCGQEMWCDIRFPALSITHRNLFKGPIFLDELLLALNRVRQAEISPTKYVLFLIACFYLYIDIPNNPHPGKNSHCFPVFQVTIILLSLFSEWSALENNEAISFWSACVLVLGGQSCLTFHLLSPTQI